MKRHLLIFLTLLAICAPGAVRAESVRPGLDAFATVYTSYLYDFSWYDSDYDSRSAENGRNLFDLDRAEIGLSGWSSQSLSGQILIEARRVQSIRYEDENGETQTIRPGNWGELQLIMKNAMFQAYIHRGFNIRAGMIPEPWIETEESAWGYRFVEQPLALRFGSGWNEADIGVEINGKFPGAYGGYAVGGNNGEGYQRVEESPSKAGYALLHVAPFAGSKIMRGLTLTGASRFEVIDNPSGNEFHAVLSPGGILRFELPDTFFLGVEGLYRARWFQDDADPNEGLAVSAFGAVRLVQQLWLIARADFYDFDLAQDSGSLSRLESRLDGNSLPSDQDTEQLALIGLAYTFAPKLRLALSYRARFWQEEYTFGPEAGSAIDPQHIGKASLEFGF
jgi:hypothetical protein